MGRKNTLSKKRLRKLRNGEKGCLNTVKTSKPRNQSVNANVIYHKLMIKKHFFESYKKQLKRDF
jgi:hypothetical protein